MYLPSTLSISIFYIVVLLLLAWGFGTFMGTIGKIRGWNAKVVSRISGIMYVAVLIAIYQFGDKLATPENGIGLIFIIIILLLISIGVLTPLFIFLLKRYYRDAFKESSPSEYVKSSNPKPADSAAKKQEDQIPPLYNSAAAEHATQPKIAPVRPVPSPAKKKKNIFQSRKGQIFISYRRSDSADISGRIFDRLVARFGRDGVFKDVDSIPLGIDFKEHIDQKVGECEVMLAIIGDNWLNASDAQGNKRLDDPTDFVRIEIESALQRNIPVIPLLVRGARMPAGEDLSYSLRKLVYRNGIPIRPDPDFHRDMDRLIAGLEKYVR